MFLLALIQIHKNDIVCAIFSNYSPSLENFCSQLLLIHMLIH